MSADHDNGNIPRNIIAKARVKNALSVFIGQLSEFRSGRLQLGKILQETKTLNSSTIAFSDTQRRSFGSGENVWRRKFSRTGERAPGMLHLTNQFHHSFDCLSLIFFVSYQRTVSRCFLDLPTTISRKVVGQSQKIIWNMINTLILTTVAVEPTFVALHEHPQTHVCGLSCYSFKFV